jgi:hypothetical protein
MANTLETIVNAYVRDCRERARTEMRFFKMQKSLAAAIRMAALGLLPSSKRHPHQRRIPRAILEEAELRLQTATDKLTLVADFAELHSLVKSEIGSMYGIGELMVYDIAHRLGAYLDKEPTLIYLHAGTRVGARLLGFRGRTIRPNQLAPAFSGLTPAEIEDCLCIYADDLRKGALMDDGTNAARACRSARRSRSC